MCFTGECPYESWNTGECKLPLHKLDPPPSNAWCADTNDEEEKDNDDEMCNA